MYATALFFSPSSEFVSAYAAFTLFVFWILSSYLSSSAFSSPSIYWTYLWDPMISSKYSSNPTSLEFKAIGFIRDICSTSPCKIKNLLCSRSIPLPYKSSHTSLNVDSYPFNIYFETDDLLTFLATLNYDPGITSYASGSFSSSKIS